jgi:hypothetical protein
VVVDWNIGEGGATGGVKQVPHQLRRPVDKTSS